MKISRLLAPFICCFTIAAPALHAQVGNNNPTGPSGEFNGSITTGCYYDPFTANGTRTLTEISIAGAVGKYGLSLTRTWNTRTPGWQYSHNWAIDVDGMPGQHETYYVTFPDGRQETFTYTTTDPDFRAALGVRERIKPWTATNGNFGTCYLMLPDGGKIEFSGTRTWEHCSDCIPTDWYEFNLAATAMIDPYGQRTTYTTNQDGSFQITEPAGRWIKIYDAYNPYYIYSITDEANNTTVITRDTNKRPTRIDYPDGGYETFTYDNNPFGLVHEHRMKSGGTESFTYDFRGLRQTYVPAATASDPNPGAHPTRYQYDALDRLSGVTDPLGSSSGDIYHTTNYAYNPRGQVTVTTLPVDPIDGVRYTIVKTYNSNGDGTLVSATDQLNHTTTYTYDDYRRLRSMTTPLRFSGDSTARTTYFSYHRNQLEAEDYTHTEANVTLLTLPSTNIVKTTYDENYRKSSVTASGAGGTDAATTSYGYDNAGNVTSVVIPDEQTGQSNYGKSTISVYDERNRVMSVTDAMNHMTTFTYDAGGHKKTATQPNGQVITYDIYDTMNRVLQQTATQTPEPAAVTKYTYTSSGLQMTMQDPHLVAIGSNYVYSYDYDERGRAKILTYPPDFAGSNRTESYTYDTAGRLGTYTNRDGKVQTFSYDALHRQTGFTWSAGSAPSVTFGYDVANRMTSITNANATISRTYFDDNLLKTETETATGGTANTVTYAWNADSNRESILYPSGKKYRYNYSGRDQLKQVQETYPPTFNYQAEYVYDVNGNLATRKVGDNLSVITDASQRDALGRCTHLEHRFSSMFGGTRTFDYVNDAMGNRTSIQRDAGTAEIYGYDFARQVTTGVDGGNAHTYGYDANGNRTALDGGGSYVTNFLNQETTFNGQTVGYDNPNGNVTSAFGGASTYIYDAQNRLTNVSNGATSTFNYDGLNRKVSQTIAGVTTYNVWDGWSLIEERGAGNALLNTYVYGAGEIIERINGATSYFYYQDGLGSTSHLSDAAGNLLESYRYGTFGQLSVYAPDGSVRKGGSSYDVRHLFTGQLWMPQTGLYDYRNRVFSPSLTRFLQPDPIGFAGDRSNLYRYCGNNSVNRSDPTGLLDMGGSSGGGGKFPPVLLKPLNEINFWGDRNYSLGGGSPNAPFSTFGFWSDLNGFPTGLGGFGFGGNGPGFGGRGGLGGSGSGAGAGTFSTGWFDIYHYDPYTSYLISVEVVGSWGTPLSFPTGAIVFLPGSGAEIGRRVAAIDWLAAHHPETNVVEMRNRIREGSLPRDVQGTYLYNSSQEIIIDPSKTPDMRAYVEEVFHELRHAQDNWGTNLWDAVNEGWLNRLTPNHYNIFMESRHIGFEYEQGR